jgi:hypothetical protein
MSQKELYAQLSRFYTRNDRTLAREYAAKSLSAYGEIERITQQYNRMENGKWNGIMDFRPRNLPVFDKPAFPDLDSLDNSIYQSEGQIHVESERLFVAAQNADQSINALENGTVVEGLGHSFSAVQMLQGKRLSFIFDIPAPGEYWIKIATLPNHDIDGKGMKIALSVDDKEIQTWDYRAVGRSETWKENVMRGQVVSTISHSFSQAGTVTLSVKALTPYIILDQVMIGKGNVHFYAFPVKRNNISEMLYNCF